jgi:hypothetical protein
VGNAPHTALTVRHPADSPIILVPAPPTLSLTFPVALRTLRRSGGDRTGLNSRRPTESGDRHFAVLSVLSAALGGLRDSLTVRGEVFRGLGVAQDGGAFLDVGPSQQGQQVGDRAAGIVIDRGAGNGAVTSPEFSRTEGSSGRTQGVQPL